MASQRLSAGLLMYRRPAGKLEVLLAHPGGPFFKNKDEGSWTIPKGEIEDEEECLKTATREFREEIGVEINPAAEFIDLGSIKQKGGKVVYAWAVEGDCDSTRCSNHFSMEWPPRSGKLQSFPEIDRAEFFSLEEAKRKINPAQIPFLDRLTTALQSFG